MRPKPYFGVTGVMSLAESNALMSVIREEDDVRVMLGLLISGKTVHGVSNKWPKRYPKLEAIPHVFPDHPKAFNLIHFNTKSPERLLEDMLLAQEMAGPYCHGFQLNIAWPDKKVLEEYKKSRSFLRNQIVLQVGGEAFAGVDHDPKKLAAKVREYEGLIDYILLDPSGGLGQEFDGVSELECFDALAETVPNVGLGIAGGLHKGNVFRKLPPLLYAHELSWDAEGKLRTSADDLDIPEAQDYLTASAVIYRVMRLLIESQKRSRRKS